MRKIHRACSWLKPRQPRVFLCNSPGEALLPQGYCITVMCKDLSLSEDKTKAELRMTAEAGNGLQVERVYTFNNSNYLIDLSIKVKNHSEQSVAGDSSVGFSKFSF